MAKSVIHQQHDRIQKARQTRRPGEPWQPPPTIEYRELPCCACEPEEYDKMLAGEERQNRLNKKNERNARIRNMSHGGQR